MARELGPTAEAVRFNITRLRGERHLSLRALSDKMTDGPGKMTHSALGEVERGVRRLDVDELTALAATLGVSPLTLLLRPVDDGYNMDEVVSLTGTTDEMGADILRWLRGDAPYDLPVQLDLDSFEAEAFRRIALPEWARNWWKPITEGRPDGAQEV
ncbi:helix-turn-helix domain-containing protein [Mycobacteroides chelonae]|uniref:helix-turn-helix domain-containing protein n=1 Tax=Mycobacteroides chelonae TaxID=1774 RepID=UPI001C2BD15F|nr:helix-turn-helix transcriptional regulator [Mycobacteroides chelonae]MBV0918252.1 helix-turn-helix domain-containing protein [Mycobacteroides chelonae]UJW66059.1 helix-turn-helix transcriptional regulator [Mycobacteroides chelonae]